MELEIIVLIVSFLFFLSIGVPIAYSVGLSSILTLIVSMESLPAYTTVAQRMASGLDSFSLLAIPFFVLAGQLMNEGGIATRLVDLAKSLLGRLPGGLVYVNILACMLFGAISGSAAAAASAIGGFMGPRMAEEGYSKPFSAAVNLTSASTGLLIPPSNVLIVYSLASGGISIAALFLAGYLPGILVGLVLMFIGGYIAYRKKYSVGEKTPMKLLVRHFIRAIPSLFLLILIIGGMVAGIFTATEASAVAVVYSLVLSFAYREVRVRDLHRILLGSIKTTCIVLFLVATSMAMSWVLSFENIPQEASEALLGLSNNKFVILLIINLLLLFIGTFMDMTPAILIFTPILLPIATDLGIHPVHFGMIMVLNLCIGLCTPPVGSLLFIGCSVADIPIQKVIKPLMPLFIGMLVVLLLVTFIPELSLWLPAAFGF